MPKIDTVVQDLMKEVIEKYYHNIKQLSVKAVYSLLIEECRKKGLSIPSYVTFTKYVNGYSSYEVVKAEKVKAYSKEFWYLEGYTLNMVIDRLKSHILIVQN